MHSGEFGESEITVHHNGDFSGEVILVLDNIDVEPGSYGKQHCTVPFDVLRALVFEYLRRKVINNVNGTTDDEFESLMTG